MTALADRSGRDVLATAGRLTGAPLHALARELGPPWAIIGDELRRRYPFADFAAAAAFAAAVARRSTTTATPSRCPCAAWR